MGEAAMKQKVDLTLEPKQGVMFNDDKLLKLTTAYLEKKIAQKAASEAVNSLQEKLVHEMREHSVTHHVLEFPDKSKVSLALTPVFKLKKIKLTAPKISRRRK